jgi:hypothetical protein
MKIKIKLFLAFMLTALMAQPAFAYIDPGSGSAIMSVIIGLFVAIGITIKTYWYKLKSIFTRNKKETKKKP